MRSPPPWTVLAAVGISGAAIQVFYHLTRHSRDAETVVVGAVVPLVVAFALVGLALLARADERTTITWRVVAWALGGAFLLTAFEGFELAYQQLRGVMPVERRFAVVRAFVRGTLLGLLAGLFDQQRRQAVRNAREREAQSERMEEFASLVAHDLRNPLSVVRGYLPLAREGDEDAFDRIERSLDRTEAIIDDALALAREGTDATTLETVSVEAVAREAWETTATTESRLVVDGDATFRADRSRLRRLFENLFRNAIEHGSTDRWSADADEGSVDQENTTADGVTVTVGPTTNGFYVADNGPGIPPDERETVFEGGYSTAASGTGFGLAIVQRIAEAHGWSLAVEESEAGGARFVFDTS